MIGLVFNGRKRPPPERIRRLWGLLANQTKKIPLAGFLGRSEGDSNPRYAFGVYTLSRRASSTTRASLLCSCSVIATAKVGVIFQLGKYVVIFLAIFTAKAIQNPTEASTFVVVEYLREALLKVGR